MISQYPNRGNSLAIPCACACIITILMAALGGIYVFQSLSPASDPKEHQAPLSELSIQSEWNKFNLKYNRNHLSLEEKEQRYKIFKNNYNKISSHNRKIGMNFKLGINPTTDWTEEEFMRYKTCGHTRRELERKGHVFKKNKNIYIQTERSTPSHTISDNDTINWTPYLPPIKDQSMCGSCWAFSGIDALEGLYKIKHNESLVFSEQLMVDCVVSPDYPGNHGCGGGSYEDVFEFAGAHGVTLETNYPYLAYNSNCRMDEFKLLKFTKGHTQVPIKDQNAMMEALRVQPLSISISAADFAFRFYQSGVVDHACGLSMGHAVNIVGSGVEKGQLYWHVRNSWGPNWGDNGYLKVLRQIGDDVPGVCGIAMHVGRPDPL